MLCVCVCTMYDRRKFLVTGGDDDACDMQMWCRVKNGYLTYALCGWATRLTKTLVGLMRWGIFLLCVVILLS